MEPHREPGVQSPSTTTLRGGDDFAVEYRNGERKSFFVRQPPIREMATYMQLYNRVQELCEFCTGQPDKAFDNLTDESLYALYDKVKALNDPRFDRWVKTQGSAVSQLVSLLSPELRQVMKL